MAKHFDPDIHSWPDDAQIADEAERAADQQREQENGTQYGREVKAVGGEVCVVCNEQNQVYGQAMYLVETFEHGSLVSKQYFHTFHCPKSVKDSARSGEAVKAGPYYALAGIKNGHAIYVCALDR